jgi:hypothetical protein
VAAGVVALQVKSARGPLARQRIEVDADMALNDRILNAPLHVTPVDSMSLTLQQAHDFLAYFLEADNAPADLQARALCTRLRDGVKRDLDAGFVVQPRATRKKRKRSEVNGGEGPSSSAKKTKGARRLLFRCTGFVLIQNRAA